jgi:hypothetical protein
MYHARAIFVVISEADTSIEAWWWARVSGLIVAEDRELLGVPVELPARGERRKDGCWVVGIRVVDCANVEGQIGNAGDGTPG